MSSRREGLGIAVNGNNQFKVKQVNLEQNLVLVPFAQECSEITLDNQNITQEVLLCTINPVKTRVGTPILHRNITNNELLLDSSLFICLQITYVLLDMFSWQVLVYGNTKYLP